MNQFIRRPRDFWAGLIFIAVGLYTLVGAGDYPMGSAGRMGPGYFPSVLGALLAVLGTVGVLRSLFGEGPVVGRFALKALALVLVAVASFGFLARNAGLVPAIVVLVLVAAYASVQFNLKKTVLLAAGMALFSSLVFVKALGLPMPVLGPWLGQ